MTTAAEARELALAAQKKKADAAKAAKQIELATQTAMVENMSRKAEEDLPGVLESIRLAAKGGKTNFVLSQYHWATKPLDNWRVYADAMKSLLVAQGYEARVVESTMEPVGSDPMFYSTVYSLDLEVQW